MPILFLAMFSIAGGQWALLQAFAWSQMLCSYSKGTPLALAICMTFDGEHPCTMCERIAQDRQERQIPPALKVEKKASDFIPHVIARILPPDSDDFTFPPEKILSFSERTNAPPSPVPKSTDA